MSGGAGAQAVISLICWEVWGARDFVGKHKNKLFLDSISLSLTSFFLKRFAIKRFWSGLFSALSLHPELL
jgi:hypothetical protein